MKVYNGTAHDVVVYASGDVVYNEDMRKYILKNADAEPLVVFPKGEKMLSVKTQLTDVETLEGYGLRLYAQVVVDIDPLPEGYDYYIVSAMYATHAPAEWRSRLLLIGEPVYEPNGRPVGCLKLIKA